VLSKCTTIRDLVDCVCTDEEAATLSSLHLGFKGILPPDSSTSSRRSELVRVVRTILDSVLRVAVGVDLGDRKELVACLLNSDWGRGLAAGPESDGLFQHPAMRQLQHSYKVRVQYIYNTSWAGLKYRHV
jgi:hypothetical protein